MKLYDLESLKKMKTGTPMTKEQIECLESEIIDKIKEKIEIMNNLRNNLKIEEKIELMNNLINDLESASAHLDKLDHDIDMLHKIQMMIQGLKNN